jgi:DNA-binding response OmpR family regulator
MEQPHAPLARITVLPVVISRSAFETGTVATLLPADGLLHAAEAIQPRGASARAFETSHADVLLLDARDTRATLVYRAIARLRNHGWKRGIVLVVHPGELGVVPVTTSLGASDFILSTASREEMEMRLRHAAAHTSRAIKNTRLPEAFAGIQLHWQTHQVSFEGTFIGLTLRELQLLSVLMERGKTITTSEDLGRLAWGKSRRSAGGLAAAYVCSLRKKLAWFGGRFGIQTVRGIGYRFIV